jgi:hypothetical protein
MPSRRIRALPALSVLPVVAAVVVGLSGCDSKTGTAALINGDRISESTVNNYLTQNAKPIPVGQDGSTTAPRRFILQILVSTKALEALLERTGGQPTAEQLSTTVAQATQGLSPADLAKRITDVGLTSKFADVYLRVQELNLYFQTREPDTAKAEALLSTLKISVNPRYGSWDPKNLTITDLSKARLPDAVNLGTVLPGDASSAPAQ